MRITTKTKGSLLLTLFTSFIINFSNAQDFVTLDTAFVQLEDCESMAEVCIDLLFAEYLNYQVLDNGVPYQNAAAGCDNDTIFTYSYSPLFGQGNLGPYMMDSWLVDNEIFSGEFMDIPDLVDSLNVWNPTGNWSFDPSIQFIFGGNSEKSYGDMEISLIQVVASSVLGANLKLEPNGTLLYFEAGQHEVVVNEISSGLSDTFYVITACPQPEIHDYTLLLNEQEQYCLDFSELPGQITSIDDLCVDSVNINVQVLPPGDFYEDIVFDTVTLSSMIDHCFDVSDLNGNITTINSCGASPINNVAFQGVDENTLCITFTALELGNDNTCFTFVDSDNDTLNVTLEVTVIPPNTSIIEDTIELGDPYDYCIDTTELGGNITQIFNDCENNLSNSVNFGINNVSLCLEAESIALGTDTACIVICNESSVCDTTIFLLTVTEAANIEPLIANSDDSSTSQNTSVVINICDNDVIPQNDLTDYYIMSLAEGGTGPNSGEVLFNDDCTITYTPNEGLCDFEDTFNYVICNDGGCADALVTVSVSCVSTLPLTIANGMSPNGDGINDVFYIEGLDLYPDHRLCIYNRWGNVVFPLGKYNNDWRGVWNGNDLPDGTYFYVLDTGMGDQITGYLQIHR